MVDKDNMSVEEMVAYCRQTDGGEAPAESAPAAPAAETDSPAAAEAPAAAPISAEQARGMSVEEMLAAARGEGGGACQKGRCSLTRRRPRDER